MRNSSVLFLEHFQKQLLLPSIVLLEPGQVATPRSDMDVVFVNVKQIKPLTF